MNSVFFISGSLVLIDGLVVHKSKVNTSPKWRQVYTFHVYDAAIAKWNERNWCMVVIPIKIIGKITVYGIYLLRLLLHF